MTIMRMLMVAAVLCHSGAALCQQEEPPPIDWNYARQLHQKEQAYQKLTDDEKVYLDRARQEYAARNAAPATQRSAPGGLAVTPTTQRATTGRVPVDQMAATDTYRGQDGGLYGQGRNQPPPEHLRAARAELAKVRKLDPAGQPSPDGKVVLLSVGMSNTMGEFGQFLQPFLAAMSQYDLNSVQAQLLGHRIETSQAVVDDQNTAHYLPSRGLFL